MTRLISTWLSRMPAVQPQRTEYVRGGGDFPAQGDEARFDALVEKFRPSLLGFMFRMVNDQTLAEQLAEETFLRVYQSRSRCAVDGDFAVVLYRFAVALVAQQQRTASAAGHVENSTVEPGSGGPPRDRQAAIRRSIEALPQRERLAVLLHKYQGLDCAQIGVVLSLNEPETKALLLRAYKTLGKQLNGI